MVNWKDFKNWLEKEVIINEDYKVKIKPEKQIFYGELSGVVLTDFMDSLEATLDNNYGYHLLPVWQGNFIAWGRAFGKKTNSRKIKDCDYRILQKIFDNWDDENRKIERMMWYEKEYKEADYLLGSDINKGRIYDDKKKYYHYYYFPRILYADIDGFTYFDLNLTSRIKKMQNELEKKENEVKWLKEQLQKHLGSEYEAQIEVNYPEKFK